MLVLVISSCSLFLRRNNTTKNGDVVRNVRQSEMKHILAEKELKVLVDYNSTNYFIYKGEPMGFQYELLKAFANDLGVQLNVQVSNDMEETFDGLNKSRYDLVAKNLTVTNEQSKLVDFTEPLSYTRQVLVQRNYSESSSSEDRKKYIKDQLDFGGKTVHVQKNTAYVKRLKSLSDEIGEPITIVEDSIYGVEELVALVASGEIDYTICNENLAMVNQKYYPWIDISVPVSFTQKQSWAVRKNSTEWKAYIDEWIVDFKETDEYEALYNKYFSNFRNSHNIRSEYHSITGGRISEFDNVIKEVSASYGWDWRLIAAIIKQESGFDKDAQSWAGATGLMQLMPQTAIKFGAKNISDPRENIKAGLEYIKSINEIFEPLVPDKNERIKFILAAYNVGIAHVIDARSLAQKFEKNPSIWKDNVEFFLQNKSLPKYYRDPVAKAGYCRGSEPCSYVNKVISTYQHYTNLLPDAENVKLASLSALQASLR